jgi:DNA mismatch repair ATPase MutS
MEAKIIQQYQTLLSDYQGKSEHIRFKIKWIAWLRLTSFLFFIPALYFIIPHFPFLGWSVVFINLFIFLGMIKYTGKLQKLKGFYQNLIDINQNEIKAIHRDLSNFADGTEFIDYDHDFSFDLDIFGHESLFQFLNRTVTSRGKNKLAQLLQFPIQDVELIRMRQLAIIELSENLDWRQQFLASGPGSKKMIADEFNLSQVSIRLNNNRLYRIALIFIPAITLITGGLWLFNVLPISYFLPFVFIQWTLFIIFYSRINRFIEAFESISGILDQYIERLGLIEKHQFKSSCLKQLKNRLFKDEYSASKIFFLLKKNLSQLDYRQNILVGFALNSLFLWDIRCIYKLQHWNNSFGNELPNWLDIIAEADALISLSNLNYNHPEWALPYIGDEKTILNAENLGHPMIRKDKRIDNDFNWPSELSVTILTGANMAGKSTFLRTLGVNLVLAAQGCKVCAGSFIFYPIRLFTHMRTTDNLMNDESYFYAELLRLKRMLGLINDGQNLLIVIDEMLKGTNSVDKLNGSIALLKQLIKHQTHCIVATHDLKLTDLAEKYPENIKNRCFEVILSGNDLQFDYKLKNGVTQTMNASFLMKKMGIIP